MSARVSRPLPDIQPKMKLTRLCRGDSKYPAHRIWCHTPKWCEDEVCCVHNPSDHHMNTWRQVWRQDTGVMERTCPHGVGHPDPDDLAVRLRRGAGIHGCCPWMCCVAA